MAKNLNYLPILKVLLEEGNVSRAALRLNLTQSAVSHVLQRMRKEFTDDLLVRSSKGMVPTPFANGIQGQLLELIDSLEKFYRVQTPFDPQKVFESIRIGTTDYIEMVALPMLATQICRDSPGITLVSRLLTGHFPKSELESGELDIAIAGYFGTLPEGYFQTKLFTDDFSSAIHKENPLAKERFISPESFAGLKHVLISPQGDLKSQVDVALHSMGLKRRVVIGTGGFLSPAWIVAESDFVVTGLTRMITSFAKYFPLFVFQLPVSVPRVQMAMVWHERTHRSPLHKWFRSCVMQQLKS